MVPLILFLLFFGMVSGGIFRPVSPLWWHLGSVIILALAIVQYKKGKQTENEKSALRDEIEKINEVTRSLVTTTNLNKLLSLIINNLANRENFSSVFFYVIEKNNILKCVATKGVVSLSGISKFSFSLENQDTVIGQALKSSSLTIVENAETSHLTDKGITEKLRLKQFLVMPLRSHEKMLGIIIVGKQNTNISFTSNDLSLLNVIANQSAIALQNAQLYSKIEDLSIVDELTQLYNVRFFHKKIKEEMELADRYRNHLSLSIVDIDFFKNYNDKNGHLAGDKCLRQVAKIISQCLRRTDIGSRYGGEEFGLILPATDEDGARNVLEKIRNSIENYPFEFSQNQPEGKVTISAGIATYPKHTKESRELIHLADLSLYQAKELGRNKVVIYKNSSSTSNEANASTS